MITKYISFPVGLAMLIYVNGCAPYVPPGVRYDNTFWNTTAAPITVTLTWSAAGQNFAEARSVTPAVYHFMGMSMAHNPEPIPETVHVKWVTQKGETHEQTVAVAGRIPDAQHFKGTVYYKFTDGGVVVIPLTYAYQEDNVRHGRTAAP